MAALGLAWGGLALGYAGPSADTPGALRRLWMLYLVWPAAFVWLAGVPRTTWKAGLRLLVASVVLIGVATVGTAWLLAGTSSPPSFLDLLLLGAAFQGVLLGAVVFGTAFFGRPGGILAPLCAGAVLTLGPCLLDTYLERPLPPGSGRAAVERALALSPPSLLAPTLLGHDLFKEEAFYRSFRAGEELVTTPSREIGMREMARIGLFLAVFAILGFLLRSGWKRRRSRVTLN